MSSQARFDAETKTIEWPADHKDELRLWLRLFSCQRLMESEVRRRLRTRFDVALPRFDLMAQLDKAPVAMNLGDLSQRLMVSRGSITGQVDRLVEHRLIERRPASNDRRVQLVKLTAEGRRIFRKMAVSHELWIAEILGDFTDGELATLMRLINKAKTSVRRISI